MFVTVFYRRKLSAVLYIFLFSSHSMILQWICLFFMIESAVLCLSEGNCETWSHGLDWLYVEQVREAGVHLGRSSTCIEIESCNRLLMKEEAVYSPKIWLTRD